MDIEIAEKKEIAKAVDAEVETLLGKIGNIVHADVPISDNEDNNVVVRTWGEPRKHIVADGSALGKLRHHELMQCLGILEMERGVKVAGHRAYYLKGLGV